MKMKKKYFAWMLLVLVACEKKDGALLPRPSEKQLLQVYVIKGTQGGGDPGGLELPDENFFKDSIPMRIQRIQVATAAEAQEQLQVLNARPVDLLFLEAGMPQEAWKNIRLPKVEGRLVVAWQNSQPRADWLSVRVDWASVLGFLSSFDLLKRGCEISPIGFKPLFQKACPKTGSLRIDFSASEDAFLRVSLRWKEIMPELIALRREAAGNGSQYIIDSRSNRIGVVPGDAMRSGADREVFIRQYKEWSLKSL